MNNPTLQAQIDAALACEKLHVPALFQQWTRPMLEAARVAPGGRVLDVACGTGVLARAASDRVGSSGTVAGVDLNPGLLAVAGQQAPSVEWRQGTAEAETALRRYVTPDAQVEFAAPAHIVTGSKP